MGERGIKKGMKSIRISFQYRGMQCRETLKLEPTKANVKYAERMKAEIERKIALGTFNYSEYFPASRNKTALLFGNNTATTTIQQGLNSYLSAIRKTLAPSTAREYESSIRMISQDIGDNLLASITTMAIRQWISSLECSNKRINNMLVPMRGMFKDLYADGVIERDPMDRIKNLSIMKHEPEPFSQDEVARITNVLPACIANMVEFAAWTGLRTGELFALTWKDIDFTRKTCRVNKSMTRGVLKPCPKTSASVRDVELLPAAMNALAAQKPTSFMAGEHIFLQVNGKPFNDDKQFREKSWMFALKKAGIQYRPPYQLRHTFASTMLSAGANPMWVAKQMGHADWGMIRKVYGKWIPQAHSEVERMAKELGQNDSVSADIQHALRT